MEVTAQNSAEIKQSKYTKDLEELENLKKKAKETKPKTPGSYFFLNVLLTLLLLLLLFLIGFGISYNNTKNKYAQESAKFTPQAQITLPKSSGAKCTPLYNLDENTKEHSADCVSAATKDKCLAVDVYNELLNNFSEGDSKPDCNWSQ